MTILRAVDLSSMRGADPLWRKRTSLPGEIPSDPGPLARSLGLPSSGFASPLGFWLAPAEVWVNPPPYTLELAPSPQPKAKAKAKARLPISDIAPGPRHGQRVVVAAHRKAGAAESQPSRMILDVDGYSARLAIVEAAWPEAAQAGILAIATSWRLDAIDRLFDGFFDEARAGLNRIGRNAIRRRRAIGSFAELQRQGRGLILDLADFEGPLTDPLRFLSTLESTRIYRRLCNRLGLVARRDRLDERAELLEGTLDTLSHRRDHRQVIVLEILIIVLLAADIAISQFLWNWE